MKLPSLVALGLLVAMPAMAQYNPSPNDPQAPVEIARYGGNLKDFRTIEIHCYSETAGDYISNALCTAADTEIRARALQNGLRVRESGGEEADDAFTLYVHITSAGIAPRGISVRVEASRYYQAAVDQNASYRDAAAHPRRGKLVMYEETITGVGQGDTLEEAMRQRLRRVIQNFFQANLKD